MRCNENIVHIYKFSIAISNCEDQFDTNNQE